MIDLRNERKWYQFCKSICKEVNKENVSSIHDLYLESISQYHPLTISETTLIISQFLDTPKAIRLIDKSIEAIKDCNMYNGTFEIQVIHLEIQKHLFLVQAGEFEGVEKKLYGLKEMELPPRVYQLYNFLGFRYFEKTGNIDYSIGYLISYIELSKDESLYNTLARYTLISQNFFNFIKIYSLVEMDPQLKEVYEVVQNGDTKRVESMNLKDLFGDSYKTVVEKTYFIGLINLCFEEKSRQIPLGKIQDGLGLKEEDIHPFLLRAFGLGLLKGWVDEKKKMLYFSTILPRTLPKEELEKMKEKYTAWKKRVTETLVMIK